jgi:hypothetical protein
MPTILNKDIYEKAKDMADAIYKKSSAYKSGFIVKKYKELGGKYANDGETKNLSRWFLEDWRDIGNKDYPVYRPTKRINEQTPLTASEIDPEFAKKQIALKQKIKGKKNLPMFI